MTREQLVSEYQALLDEGLTYQQIAERYGKAYSSIANVLSDPDGSKQRERRKRYQGKCVDCGGPTEGSGGYKNRPVRCAPCAAADQRAHRHWTRERVLTAITLWAEEHGRPPTSTEWLRVGKDRSHPALSNVYVGPGSPNAPFTYWADAIEAAGFERPRVGHYERTEETLRRYSEARIKWRREVILERIREWAGIHGSPPTSNAWRGMIHGRDYWPNREVVIKRFGTWNAAIAEAGFKPRRQGWPTADGNP